jgi:hypothetical protein
MIAPSTIQTVIGQIPAVFLFTAAEFITARRILLLSILHQQWRCINRISSQALLT